MRSQTKYGGGEGALEKNNITHTIPLHSTYAHVILVGDGGNFPPVVTRAFTDPIDPSCSSAYVHKRTVVRA